MRSIEKSSDFIGNQTRDLLANYTAACRVEEYWLGQSQCTRELAIIQRETCYGSHNRGFERSTSILVGWACAHVSHIPSVLTENWLLIHAFRFTRCFGHEFPRKSVNNCSLHSLSESQISLFFISFQNDRFHLCRHALINDYFKQRKRAEANIYPVILFHRIRFALEKPHSR
jgi:hypothetical protein